MENQGKGPLRSKALAFALLFLAWLSSGYLLYRSLSLGDGSAGGDVCSAVFGRGCDETLLASSSTQLGYPLAGWGLVYFVVVGLLIAIGTRPFVQAALLLTAGGVGASLVMATALLAGRAPLCPLCLVTHAANLGLLLAVWSIALPGGKVQLEAPKGKRWLALTLAVLVAGAWVEAGLYGRAATGDMPTPEEIVAAYEAAEVVELPADAAESPGRATLVVFSSFQCPACQQFAMGVRHLQEHLGDDLAIVYKHFPLEQECNPALAGDPQPRSCEAAAAAEAARLQGGFWPYHDGLFATDLSATEELLKEIAADLELDVARWETDRQSVAALSRVYADAQLGAHLGIQGTPTVFLNRRRLGNPPLPVLEVLIGHLLEVETAH